MHSGSIDCDITLHTLATREYSTYLRCVVCVCVCVYVCVYACMCVLCMEHGVSKLTIHFEHHSIAVFLNTYEDISSTFVPNLNKTDHALPVISFLSARCLINVKRPLNCYFLVQTTFRQGHSPVGPMLT